MEQNEYGSWNMYLSLIDLGDAEKVIPANLVFGCNFAIRKSVLFECGGFHPDSFPGKMIRWRGDGEAGLALALMRKGHKTVYNPAACIKHVVPESRMNAAYFCKRAFAEGVSNSYTQIRKNGRLTNENAQGKDDLEKSNEYAIQVMNGTINIKAKSSQEIKKIVGQTYKQGFLFHQRQVMNDPELLTYVLKRDYYHSAIQPLKAGIKTTQSKSKVGAAATAEMEDSTSAKIIYQQANSFKKDGMRLLGECLYNEALSCFDNAMYRYTDLKNLHYHRGVCLLSVGRVVEAEAALKAELKSQPGFQPALTLSASLPHALALGDILATPTKLTYAERMLLYASSQNIPDGGTIVEIGSFVGASSCFLAEGARRKNGRVFCIDTWNNDAMPGDRRDTFPEFQTNTAAYSDLITPLRGLSTDMVTEVPGPIDLLFVDGDHSYAGCRSDIEAWISRLKDGGTVIFHDYGWAKGVQKAVAEYVRPIESSAGKQVDSIYYTTIRTSLLFKRPPSQELSVKTTPSGPKKLSEKTPAMSQQGRSQEVSDRVAESAKWRRFSPHRQFLKAARLFESGRLDESEKIIRTEIGELRGNSEARNFLTKIRQERFSKLVEANCNETDADLSWVDRTPMIQNSAVIYITEMCNSRCITCNAWKSKKEEQLPTDIWIDILRQIRASGFSTVEFVGGEPLLRPDLSKLTAEAKALGFSTIMVSSNGFLLNQSHIGNLIQNGVNSFHISLDGMRDTYEFIRGVDRFDKVTNAIRIISEAKIPSLILTTLVRQNITELEAIVSMAKKHGSLWFANILENMKFLFKGIDMARIQISESREINQVVERLNILSAEYSQTCILRKEDVLYIKDYLEDPNRESRVPCPLGFNESYFDARGNVYPGCMSLQPAGNVIQTPLQQIVDSTTMRSRLKAMLLRKCPGCTCGYPQRAQLMYGRSG